MFGLNVTVRNVLSVYVYTMSSTLAHTHTHTLDLKQRTGLTLTLLHYGLHQRFISLHNGHICINKPAQQFLQYSHKA